MSTMKELIEKCHLPKNTTGVQVSNCLGITAYVRRVIRGYFKDCESAKCCGYCGKFWTDECKQNFT